jgi:hypothetical protein
VNPGALAGAPGFHLGRCSTLHRPRAKRSIAIPPEERDSGRGRAFLRIGFGEASWIGSFETGHMSVSTIVMMPDGKQLPIIGLRGSGSTLRDSEQQI